MKLTVDHPTFARIADEILAKVADAEARFQAMFLRMEPALILAPETLQGKVEKSKEAMHKRLSREFGLTGKYVAH